MLRIDCGRLFHAVGPATEKALEPIRVLVRGMSYSPSVAERSYINQFTSRHYSGSIDIEQQ